MSFLNAADHETLVHVYDGKRCQVTGKLIIKKRRAAQSEATRLNKYVFGFHGIATAYKCRACGRWHVGKQGEWDD